MGKRRTPVEKFIGSELFQTIDDDSLEWRAFTKIAIDEIREALGLLMHDEHITKEAYQTTIKDYSRAIVLKKEADFLMRFHPTLGALMEEDITSREFYRDFSYEDAGKSGANDIMVGKSQTSVLKNAEYFYTRALELAPASSILLLDRSAARLAIGELSGALADAETCIQVRPTFVKGYCQKGVALGEMNRHKEAIQVFVDGRKIDPGNKELKLGLAQSLRALQAAREGELMWASAYSQALLAPKDEALLCCAAKSLVVYVLACWNFKCRLSDSAKSAIVSTIERMAQWTKELCMPEEFLGEAQLLCSVTNSGMNLRSSVVKDQWPLQIVTAVSQFCDARFPNAVRSTAVSRLGVFLEEEKYAIEFLKRDGLQVLLRILDDAPRVVPVFKDVVIQGQFVEHDAHSTIVTLLMHEQGARLDVLAVLIAEGALQKIMNRVVAKDTQFGILKRTVRYVSTALLEALSKKRRLVNDASKQIPLAVVKQFLYFDANTARNLRLWLKHFVRGQESQSSECPFDESEASIAGGALILLRVFLSVDVELTEEVISEAQRPLLHRVLILSTALISSSHLVRQLCSISGGREALEQCGQPTDPPGFVQAAIERSLSSGQVTRIRDHPSECAAWATKACAACGALGADRHLKTCSGCNVARYCSSDCQTLHWKNGHKNMCKRIVAKA